MRPDALIGSACSGYAKEVQSNKHEMSNKWPNIDSGLMVWLHDSLSFAEQETPPICCSKSPNIIDIPNSKRFTTCIGFARVPSCSLGYAALVGSG